MKPLSFNVFFNTQTQAPKCCLQLTGEFFLTPVRYFANGCTLVENINIFPVKIEESTYYVTTKTLSEKKDVVQMCGHDYPIITGIVMAILYIPCAVAGTILKIIAHFNFLFYPILKPVFRQQQRYNQFYKQPNQSLEQIAPTFKKRAFCLYDNKTVELLSVNKIENNQKVELIEFDYQGQHNKRLILSDTLIQNSTKTKITYKTALGAIEMGNVTNLTSSKTDRLHLTIQTLASYFFNSFWNPTASV